MNFGEAITKLKNGKRVARAGWNGKGMFLAMISGVSFDNTEVVPFIAIYATNKKFSAWNASQQGVFSDDWQVVSEV